jgi:hypothetical protein
VGEYAAFQKRVELVGDKRWQAHAAGVDINEGKEGVEVCLHHAVERGFFGAVALVADSAGRCWAHMRGMTRSIGCICVQYIDLRHRPQAAPKGGVIGAIGIIGDEAIVYDGEAKVAITAGDVEGLRETGVGIGGFAEGEGVAATCGVASITFPAQIGVQGTMLENARQY